MYLLAYTLGILPEVSDTLRHQSGSVDVTSFSSYEGPVTSLNTRGATAVCMINVRSEKDKLDMIHKGKYQLLFFSHYKYDMLATHVY